MVEPAAESTAEPTAEPTPPAKLPKRIVDLLARMGAAFDRIDAFLLRMGVQGVQRLSRSSVDELGALKQTAHNAGLVNISRELEALATQTTRYLDRDPTFDMGAFVGGINRIWLLNRAARARHATGALPEDMLDLNGRARRSFTILDTPLDVQALGAFGWVTDSGFVGVTVHCRAEGRAPVVLSVARPTMHFGSDPQMLYGFELNAALDQTARDMAHGAHRLTRAKLSSDDRLSMHAEMSIGAAPYLGGRAYDDHRVSDWRAIVERIRAADASPVQRSDGVLVLVEAVSMSAMIGDRVRAVSEATLRDARGAPLSVHVPMRRENNLLIDNLEHLARQPGPKSLFGKAWIADEALRFIPYTAVYATPQKLQRFGRPVHGVHLSLEVLPGRDGKGPRRRRR